MTKDNLADNLRWERKKRGMSLGDVAAALKITVRRAFSYESGESEPDLDLLVEYADFYDTTVDDLLEHKESSLSKMDGSQISLAKFGERLRQFRVENNLSAKEIAAQSDISRQYLSSIESGAKTPSFETAVKIMKAMGITPNYAFMDILPEAYSTRARYLEIRSSVLSHVNQSLLMEIFEHTLKILEDMENSQTADNNTKS